MSIFDRTYGYDIECYPNVFTIELTHIPTDHRWIFEVSDRMNQSVELVAFLFRLRDAGCSMLGFNNEGYDYPVIHHVISTVGQFGIATAAQIYEKSATIIASPWGDWTHSVPPWKRIIRQIDVFKIMHFDNMARSTSLKKLEMAMRSSSVEDLPFKPGYALQTEQIDPLIKYQSWDVNQTIKFAKKIEDRIQFRADLSDKYGRDVTNFNDTKIGKEHFIAALEAEGVACFDKSSGRKVPIQTPRYGGIHVGAKLLWVPFQTPQLQAMWQFFYDAVIPPDETKGFFKNVSASIGEFTIDFGAGGIHGSVHNRTFYTTETHEIIDVDVTSYYPSLAIVNNFHPEHMGPIFCKIYAELKAERMQYDKKTAQSGMLKLALNGVYGDSNNKHSPFYDPAYTMAITINGQLQLAWLAETLHFIPGVEMIQANTDGITVYCPKDRKPELWARCEEWERATMLDLEAVTYSRMHIKDVNNYVAVNQ